MYRLKKIFYLCGISLILLLSCNKKLPVIQIDRLFTLMPPDYTQLEFENTLVDETDFNVFKYRNYYNGGGVAIGDVNNDGLPDVYLIANQKSNKLFLNEGNFQFRERGGQELPGPITGPPRYAWSILTAISGWIFMSATQEISKVITALMSSFSIREIMKMVYLPL